MKPVQADIPICEKPYSILAEKLKISEESFITILKELNDKGFIRRFGATLRHQKSGFKSNAMVAWQVDEDAVEDTGINHVVLPLKYPTATEDPRRLTGNIICTQ